MSPGGGHQLRLCQPGGSGSPWHRIRWRKPVTDRVAGAGVIIFAVVLVTLGKYLFPFAAKLPLVKASRNKRQFADPLGVDLRVVSGARSLFQTLGERLVIQLQATAQAHSRR